jgi:hypothetical protein
MMPGKSEAVGSFVGEIENIASETHCPDEGTSNLRSNQMAVASLSGFMDSHNRQAGFKGAPLSLVLTWVPMT